ncbi:MAG: hypothetical protein K8F31_09615 [Roseovarius sp.]|nr:hypothetical protein [Roseovarius sp.]
MSYLAYNALMACAAPMGRLWLTLNRRHRPLLQRFAPPVPPVPARPIWIHACSVGEVNVAAPLAEALIARRPDWPILLTVSTLAGREHAETRLKHGFVTWCPFDLAHNVRRFIQSANPRILLLIETELWPNMLRECARAGVPSLLVNGRLSDKHISRYLRMGRLMRHALGHLTHAAVQHDEYAARLRLFEYPENQISVVGNLKFDAVSSSVDPGVMAEITRALGLRENEQLVVFGSTRPGDEDLAAHAIVEILKHRPGTRFAIVPRHIERASEISRILPAHTQRWSSLKKNPGDRAQVIIVDTLGELLHFYALATIAVVGGSFYSGVNGHNPLEPAALGTPTVFGPYMRNFIEPAEVLLRNQGAVQVASPGELPAKLVELLNAPEQLRTLAQAGQNAIESRKGGTDITLDLVDKMLDHAPAIPG